MSFSIELKNQYDNKVYRISLSNDGKYILEKWCIVNEFYQYIKDLTPDSVILIVNTLREDL